MEKASVNNEMNPLGTIFFATCDQWRRGVYLTQEHATILVEYSHARDHASNWLAFYNGLSPPTLEYLCPFFGSDEGAPWSADLGPAESYHRPETPMSVLIEKDYLIGSGLGDGTPMIQCANDSYRALDLSCIEPFKTGYKLMNDVADLDTPMYSKSKFYDMFILLKEQGYRVDVFDWSDFWKP
jgi:hypothetical protein